MNRRMLLKELGALALLSASPLAFAQQGGQRFVTLPSKVASDVPAGKVEVVEFFHYGCPHCRNFDPLLKLWVGKQPADVVFRQVPVMWGNQQLLGLARLYYGLEAAGSLEKLNTEVFTAVQDKKLPLHTAEGAKEWAAAQGVDADKFAKGYQEAPLMNADSLARSYRIQGVPSMAVGGRFVTSASLTGSHEGTLAVVDELIAQVRAGAAG